MKKISLFVLILMVLTSLAYAKSGELVRDSGNKGNPIQGAAWNGSKAFTLTIASTTIDFTSDIAAKIYTATDCWERWMPLSTSTKASYVQTPLLSGTWETTVINPATPFGNFSGCTGGAGKRQ